MSSLHQLQISILNVLWPGSHFSFLIFLPHVCWFYFNVYVLKISSWYRSEVKGSFALTASPHGDSVESSGRLGAPPTVCEPNSADNLLLFDGENEILESERNSVHHSRGSIVPSEQSSQLDASQKNGKELVKNHAYRRRNRSRTNRSKVTISDLNNQKENQNGDVVLKTAPHDNVHQTDKQLDGSRERRLDAKASEEENLNEHSQVDTQQAVIHMKEERNEIETVKQTSSGPIYGFSKFEIETKGIANEGQNSTKGLDSESSCTRTSQSVDGNNDSDLCINRMNIGANGNNNKEELLASERQLNVEGDEMLTKKTESKCVESGNIINDSGGSNEPMVKVDEQIPRSTSILEKEVKYPVDSAGMELNDHTVSIPESRLDENTSSAPEVHNQSENNLKVAKEAHEDSILEEARTIEVISFMSMLIYDLLICYSDCNLVSLFPLLGSKCLK